MRVLLGAILIVLVLIAVGVGMLIAAEPAYQPCVMSVYDEVSGLMVPVDDCGR